MAQSDRAGFHVVTLVTIAQRPCCMAKKWQFRIHHLKWWQRLAPTPGSVGEVRKKGSMGAAHGRSMEVAGVGGAGHVGGRRGSVLSCMTCTTPQCSPLPYLTTHSPFLLSLVPAEGLLWKSICDQEAYKELKGIYFLFSPPRPPDPHPLACSIACVSVATCHGREMD